MPQLPEAPHEPAPPDDGADRRAGAVIFRAGLVLAGTCALALGVLAVIDPATAGRITAVVAAAFVGGRVAGTLTGLELGFGFLGISVMLICLNTSWLLIALPLFQHLTSRIEPPQFLVRSFRRAEVRARSANQRLHRLGALGLVLFVWLPFPFTGAFIGAVIGLLMGIRLPRLVPLVLVSMWVGVLTWTAGFEAVLLVAGPVGRIVAWVLTLAFIAYSLILRARDARLSEAE
jgi:uncharacterized membrane protein